jgi:peptidoglycan-associated lipoprotein
VRDYIAGLGVSADRLSVVPYGKERPAVLGETEEAWAVNRRAETKVQAN